MDLAKYRAIFIEESAEHFVEISAALLELDAPTRIQDLDLHPEAKVGARLRGDAVIVPSGSDELAAGDHHEVVAPIAVELGGSDVGAQRGGRQTADPAVEVTGGGQ